MSKYFVAYLSASGKTARLAKTVAGAVGGDLYEIVPEQRYSTADLNWQAEEPQHAGNERRGVPAGHCGKGRRDSGGGVRPGRVPDLVVSGAQNYSDFPGEL